jgi:hypothetical protein
MTQGKISGLLAHLCDRAVQKLAEDSPLMKFYGSKGEFERDLRETLLEQSEESTSTPEEVLDPIGYVQIC